MQILASVNKETSCLKRINGRKSPYITVRTLVHCTLFGNSGAQQFGVLEFTSVMSYLAVGMLGLFSHSEIRIHSTKLNLKCFRLNTKGNVRLI